uniref:Reverse transcriptase domain-containing protein n=1 Tax=Vitis vinifera TaxID=29760 RepID=A5B1I0_VITVI|nr:hypothetical protein VITISV_041596 [Vitis vinifera]
MSKPILLNKVSNLVTVSQGDTAGSLSGEFQIEGLPLRKMAKVREVLSSLDIKETKKAECDRRFVGSVWTVRNKECVTLPMYWASGGILIIWDSKKLRSEEVVIGSFSVSVMFALDGCGPLWLSAVYGPNSPLLRQDFWAELLDIFGLFFPFWQNRKYIKVLENERGPMLNNSESIKEEILMYFEKLYSSPSRESWGVEGLDWSPIFGESASRLDSPFIEEEISKIIFQLDRDKAPGPDGFTIAVFQDCWDVIKEDLVRVFAEFHRRRQILDAVLIANEIMDEKRRSEEEGIVFKIDFEKAYDHNHLSRLAELLDCKASGWPILYLGLPLGGNPKACGFWDPVIERISRRLDG